MVLDTLVTYYTTYLSQNDVFIIQDCIIMIQYQIWKTRYIKYSVEIEFFCKLNNHIYLVSTLCSSKW